MRESIFRALVFAFFATCIVDALLLIELTRGYFTIIALLVWLVTSGVSVSNPTLPYILLQSPVVFFLFFVFFFSALDEGRFSPLNGATIRVLLILVGYLLFLLVIPPPWRW